MELTTGGPCAEARQELAASAECSDGATIGNTRNGTAASWKPAGVKRRKDAPSPRELEVAALIRQGLTNAEIAERLALSPGTVANHVANILTRLNLRNRAQLAAWATEHGVGGTRPTFEQPHEQPGGRGA